MKRFPLLNSQILGGFLLFTILFCQFLGIQHSIDHGLIQSTTFETYQYTPNALVTQDTVKDSLSQNQGNSHHCVAWDHATLSCGPLSLTGIFINSLFSFDQFIQAPHIDQAFQLFTSFLTRAPPTKH